MKDKFIEQFKEVLEIEDREISLEDVFRDYDEWDSLVQLSLIAMLDEEFEVSIEEDDFEKLVTVGDAVAFKRDFALLGKHRVMSKGLDDKIGAFVVAETLRKLAAKKLDVAVFAVGTVQEELGLRGAATSAFGIAPDVGIAVDVGFATDVPDIDKKSLGEAKLGGGPMLERNADNNPVLGRLMRKVASKNKIKIQEQAGFRASGGTDTSRVQLTRGGVATALVSIPNRYMHTQVEMCDLRDVENAVKLIAETVASIKPNDSFIPGE